MTGASQTILPVENQIFNFLIFSYHNTNRMKGTLFLLCGYCSALISLAQPATTSSADSLYERAKYFYYNDHDSAIHYLQQVADISKKINYRKGTANALSGFGIVAESDREQLKYYSEALEIRTQIHDSIGMGVSLQTIGNLYDKIKMKEMAREYVNRSIAIKARTRDYGGLALSYIYLGKWDMEAKNYEQASVDFGKALVYRKLDGKPQGLAYAFINLAELNMALNRPDTAISLASKARQYFTEVNDRLGLLWSYQLLGKLMSKNSPGEARQFYLSALNLNPNSLEAKQGLSSLYAAEGDFKKAYQFQKDYADSYQASKEASSETETRQMAADYEYQLREKERARESEREASRINRRNNLQFISISIGVLSVFALLVAFRQKVSVKFLNALVFLAFLFLFEFLFVLADPTVSRLSQGQPYIQLFTNAVLALSILPVQQLMESRIKRILAIPGA